MLCDWMSVMVSFRVNSRSIALYALVSWIYEHMPTPNLRGTRTTGIKVEKNEPQSLISQLPFSLDKQQSVKLQYKIQNIDDIGQISRTAGGQIEINYPVEDADRLRHLKLIESQFAAANIDDQLDPSFIDTVILSAMPYCLDQEGVSLPDDPILARRVKALILRQARGMQYRTDLLDYLNQHPKTARSLGFETTDDTRIVSESTLSRSAGEWGMDEQPAQNAIRRLRHILFRNGILPDQFAQIGFATDKAIPHSSQLPDQLRCQGLVNYADLLLREIAGISLNRDSGIKYSSREVIATVAQIALHDNPSKARQLSQWHYESDIPTFQRIQQIVSEEFYRDNILLGKSRTETLDKKLHEAMFRSAENIGMFKSPIDIALDPTWVPVADNVDDTPGAIRNPTISKHADGGFTYPMAVAYDPISLSLGVRYVPEKSQYPNAFRKLLSQINDFGEIGWILADREFDSADMISLLRSAAGKKWTIRLREHHDVLTQPVRQSLDETGKAQVVIGDHTVNVFSKDYTAKHPNIDDSGNMILLSDMPITDIDLSEIVGKYIKRWTVETYIRQIKHDLSPKTNLENAILNQFIFTIASTFYNIWALINQSVSPVYGLPLHAQYYDVLKAIVQSTFSRRRQFHPQINESN